MKKLIGLIVFSISSGMAQFTGQLSIPQTTQVNGFENDYPSVYSTGSYHFRMPKSELLKFLTVGKVQPFDSATFYSVTDKLQHLAPFSPPSNLSGEERKQIDAWNTSSKDWIANTTTFLSSYGAFSTKDGQIYFWRKINDHVLVISQWSNACYLVID